MSNKTRRQNIYITEKRSYRKVSQRIRQAEEAEKEFFKQAWLEPEPKKKVRTWLQAAKILVEWWCQKSFRTPLNKNNGDDSPGGGLAWALMNTIGMNAQDKVSQYQIDRFSDRLTKILLLSEGDGKYASRLSVDYNPNAPLAEALAFAEIDPMVLPIKTTSFIDPEDNTVHVAYGYRGPWEII